MLRGYSAVVGIGQGQRWARHATGRVGNGFLLGVGASHQLVVKRNRAENGGDAANRRCESDCEQLFCLVGEFDAADQVAAPLLQDQRPTQPIGTNGWMRERCLKL